MENVATAPDQESSTVTAECYQGRSFLPMFSILMELVYSRKACIIECFTKKYMASFKALENRIIFLSGGNTSEDNRLQTFL